MVPPVVSPAAGAGLPSASVPWPVAVQLTVEAAVNVQLKSCDAPGARLGIWTGENAAHGPGPVADTLVIAESPVFFSVSTIVTGVPAVTTVPGVTLMVVSAVAGRMTVMVPLVVSPVVDNGFWLLSNPMAVAVQGVVTIGVNVHEKSVDAPGANWVLPPVQGVQPMPLTETPTIVELPRFVSVTVIVTAVPDATVVPGATLLIIKLVTCGDAETVMVPLVVSFAGETGLPSASVPCPVAVQLVVALG